MIPPDGVCDLWVAPTTVFAPHERRLDALLTPEERAGVQAYRRKPDRSRARLSRALLRLLLARYLELEPRRVDLDRRCPACGQDHGKPRLRDGQRLEFSVAHAADLLVFAFDGRTPVGVDVESLDKRTRAPSAELLDLTLTPAERRHLEQAPPAERWSRFLEYWTCKEAVLKQLGTGLSLPLHHVHVAVHPTGPDRRVDLEVDGLAGAAVWATSLRLGDGHVAAVATARAATRLRTMVASEQLIEVVGAL